MSLSGQWLYAYIDGTLAFDNAVETGHPELPTPSGRFSVLEKLRGVTFTSPWPPGSPNYYEPTDINYALLFKAGGYFLHDAWWPRNSGRAATCRINCPMGVGRPVPMGAWG